MNEQSPLKILKNIPAQPSEEDQQLVEEVRFIEKKGREPDGFDMMESHPSYVFDHLAQELDLTVNLAASITAMLQIAKEKGIQLNEDEIDGVAEKFRLNQEHMLALFYAKRALMDLAWNLRENLGNETYINEVLPKVKELEGSIKEETHNILTGYGEGEDDSESDETSS